MTFDSIDSLPARVQVSEVMSSRYDMTDDSDSPVRPTSWDLRTDGEDIVRTKDGQTIRLYSDGGQSTPAPGWVILLTAGDAGKGYHWTLYGLPPKTVSH